MVTGAAAGIGRATALAFLQEGADVWALDVSEGTLLALADEAPEIHTRRVDVTNPAEVEVAAAEIGGVDVLMNCAGAVVSGTVLDCTEEQWTEAMDVNVTSMFRMIRAFLPGMLERRRGSIINVSSTASSVKGVPDRFAYGTSKAAVIGLTKSVAVDFVGRGIRCNAICPGTVDSPSLRRRLQALDDPDAARREFIARQPMGRFGTPEEIAALAVHLASDESGFTTGAVHVADGGMTL